MKIFNPSKQGMFQINALSQSPGDMPISRYIGSWSIDIRWTDKLRNRLRPEKPINDKKNTWRNKPKKKTCIRISNSHEDPYRSKSYKKSQEAWESAYFSLINN